MWTDGGGRDIGRMQKMNGLEANSIHTMAERQNGVWSGLAQIRYR